MAHVGTVVLTSKLISLSQTHFSNRKYRLMFYTEGNSTKILKKTINSFISIRKWIREKGKLSSTEMNVLLRD